MSPCLGAGRGGALGNCRSTISVSVGVVTSTYIGVRGRTINTVVVYSGLNSSL